MNIERGERTKMVYAARSVKLTKSYRSSFEITRFAQGISPSADLVAIERHGSKPRVVACCSPEEETARVLEEIGSFATKGFQTMGIVCKTQGQAERLYQALAAVKPDLHLLTSRSKAFVRGAVVCAVHLAKGLEFDQVVVPYATRENYSSSLDRNLLYVACTRAMHDLTMTHTGALTQLIDNESSYVTS